MLEMLLLYFVVVWIAFFFGIIVGWAWKPRWATLDYKGKFNYSLPSSPSALIATPIKGFGSTSSAVRNPSDGTCAMENGADKEQVSVPVAQVINCRSAQPKEEECAVMTEEDLEHLCHLVDRKDGGPPWRHMMDRSAPSMSYQAWQRDPENGPPQYCSKTVYEDATPELLRDFFWDDEFRLKWDDMLIHSSTIKQCPITGAMVVHWIRKFPFFCSDREYIIGRRIWQSERSYYCVTKGVPCPSIPKRDKPRRVDHFYSSWCIQEAASRKGNGQQLTACEVILFHHEDMGIPREITKFGIRQGMWGAVKNIERGLRLYQMERASGAPLSPFAILAQINTKINPDYMKSLEISEEDSPETELQGSLPEKPGAMNLPKLIVFGGAIVLACSLDHGLLTKAVIFGVARRFGNIGRRL